MTVYDSHMYGDPAKILERKQANEARMHRACGQCVHRTELPMDRKVIFFCSRKFQTYGHRCHLFRIANEA